jgi:hypothetical protein
LSQNSSSASSEPSLVARSGLAAKFSLVKSQLSASTVTFFHFGITLPSSACSILGSKTAVFCSSPESSMPRSFMLGEPNLSATLAMTSFGDFFQAAALMAIGLVLVKLEQL